MKNYRVTWFMVVEAESPQLAAEEALAIHRDPESIATIFTVQDELSSTCIDAATGDELPSDFPGLWAGTEA
jgi:hypothetical protein